ncbi:MAG: bifunctional 3,4-dihydroxy-2-butanone-4-phosphate synthase/GTP cyclohydrolase II [Sideroxydans sp.]|nr:bifunctional 3,4-dihydroxy-2-butanone-4-phosphate synthase/GTP cyclohydrolase II [Sideroxydans sp.]
MTGISPITEIIDEIRAGRMVVLMDEEDRENEGDLVFAAEFSTPEKINFMAKHGRGLICLTLTAAHCEQLDLPLMVRENGLPLATNFTLSIEAASGVTTGISAADRSRTVLAAAAKNAKPADIVQPGHIFPLRAQNGGVLVRAGHTEAGCDLSELAGLTPASVICEILKDDGEMARLPDLIEFAKLHGLKIGTIADLIEHRSQHEKLVERVAMRKVKTAYGEFDLATYVDKTTQRTHLALVKGAIQHDVETLVRVHEPLSVLDFLEHSEEGASTSVHQALQKIAQAKAGVLVMLHRSETSQNLLARATQTSARNAQWDSRSYGIGAQILRDLQVGKMRLLATPHKMPSMTGFGLEVVGYATC